MAQADLTLAEPAQARALGRVAGPLGPLEPGPLGPLGSGPLESESFESGLLAGQQVAAAQPD